MLAAHACHPSYSGGRDQEDHSWRPVKANSLQDHISKKKKKPQKRIGGVAQGLGPEFKLQVTHKKKKKERERQELYWLLYQRKCITKHC
jgi:hypothetical protein